MKPPRAIESPEPLYSDEARAAHLEGTAVFHLVVKADGTTDHIELVRGLGKGLDEEGIEALKKWRFQPATANGQPVPVRISVQVVFRLSSQSPPPQAAAPDSLSPKARKTYQQGLEQLQQRNQPLALRYFRDADKQERGNCLPCHEQLVQVGLATHDWKAVEDGASGLASEVKEPKQQAVAHYYLGMALFHEGTDQHHDDFIQRAHDELTKAIALDSSIPDILFLDGKALAQLHKDEEAKTQFQKFVAMAPEGKPDRRRALQFISKPELARANLVPEFVLFTNEGQRVSPESLAGKVVLVHFWSTMCDTCSNALPHLRDIAKKLQDQPFVLLSISVDYRPDVWRSFLEKNDVPGLQYMDGFNGPVAQAFGVGINMEVNTENTIAGVWRVSHALKQDVPRTFTIDADGVLQAEKLSGSLDARLQDLIARANAGQPKQK